MLVYFRGHLLYGIYQQDHLVHAGRFQSLKICNNAVVIFPVLYCVSNIHPISCHPNFQCFCFNVSVSAFLFQPLPFLSSAAPFPALLLPGAGQDTGRRVISGGPVCHFKPNNCPESHLKIRNYSSRQYPSSNPLLLRRR